MCNDSTMWMSCVAVVSALVAGAPLVAAEPALKDAFANDFKVGTALSTRQVMGEEPAALELVARQFNAITPENLLKWAEVHPEPGKYDFEPVDKYVEFGEKHGMFVVGHTLVWHNQTPEWAFAGMDGKPLDRETALARIKEHIETVVGRYKGRIKGWDVVNEAIDDKGKLRSGPVGPPSNRGEPWHAAIGDDYIQKAFEFAHAADPDAELYYNDFNEWHPAKVRAISELVNSLKAKGVRIDGLGLQGHWGMDYPSLEEIDHMLTEYGKLGVKLMITELDINLLPDLNRARGADITRRERLRKELDPYANGLPDEIQKKLADRYAKIFALFHKHRDKIDRVTFWGVHDGQSWLNYWPTQRTSYPLLFDRELRPKPALEAVIKTATGSEN
jgi:endo-1,4-beta-xylanase